MEVDEIGYLIDYKRPVAKVVKDFLNYLPQVEVNYIGLRHFIALFRDFLEAFMQILASPYTLKPIAQTVLKMDLFEYNSRWHSKAEVFWLIVDNE